jgi:hypothetical protein
MVLDNQIRSWQPAGFLLLCLVLHGLALAQTSPAPAQAAPASTTKSHTTKRHTTKHQATGHTSDKHGAAQKGKSARSKKGRKRGQQAIDSTRARQIQQALIREHYMQGEPSGYWDSASQAAMQRYQADHGWQAKTTPDARALIELGLGPSHDHLLNPENAMTSAPADSKAGPKPAPVDGGNPNR